jgi:hypothetical protein
VIPAGIATQISASMFFEDNFFQIEGPLYHFATEIYIGILCVFLISIIASICGMFTLKINDKLYASMYGATLLPILVTMALYSTKLESLVTDTENGLTPFCNLSPT